ncbi:MAG: hypothetical protein IAF02_04775 [Anaerolineae bacterium]|nr:hypothetical protein [Anaerolineae bacterium]
MAATVTSAAASVTPVPGAWRGDYYNNKNLENPIVMAREDFISPINNIYLIFNWGTGSPGSPVNSDNFSVNWRYNGNFSGANYLFYAFSDDGVRVFVDGTTVINQWTNATNNVLYGNITLSGGQHQVQTQYFEDKGDARIAVGWQLTQSNAWIGEYYANNNLGQPPVYINQDNTIDFNWQQGSPSALPSDNFSIRWFRNYNFGSSAMYRFRVNVDDGVRVKVGNTTIIDEWHTVSSPQTYQADIQLSGTQKVTVEYFEGTGNAQIQLAINPVVITTATATATATPTTTTTATATSTATTTATSTATSTATNTPVP